MDEKFKIAVLFRGPVRPTVQSTVARCSEFMAQMSNIQNATITTYLATWRNWKQNKASELLATDMFDNVIMQTEPTDAQIARATKIKNLPNGAEIRPVFNMYYQSKTALDLIAQADDYHFIVHSRTDIAMQLGQHLPDWFDANAYTAPHVHGVLAPHAPHVPAEEQWMCDQFGIAPAGMMHAAWNYGSIAELGQRIEAADKPEAVLQTMMTTRNIPAKAPSYVQWQLDPRRNA